MTGGIIVTTLVTSLGLQKQQRRESSHAQPHARRQRRAHDTRDMPHPRMYRPACELNLNLMNTRAAAVARLMNLSHILHRKHAQSGQSAWCREMNLPSSRGACTPLPPLSPLISVPPSLSRLPLTPPTRYPWRKEERRRRLSRTRGCRPRPPQP